MTMTRFFKQIPNKCVILPELQQLLHKIKPEDWHDYYNFKVVLIDFDTVCAHDPFLAKLHHAHPFQAGICKLTQNIVYDWHTDERRGASINLLLNELHSSHCLFKTQPGELVSGIRELDYEPGRYYLFNSQEEHTVINFHRDRFLFTIEFVEAKEALSYQDLLIELAQD